MGLTAITSLESARRKFFMNSTYMMSTKKESNAFGAQEAKMSLTAISSLESERRKFRREENFMNSTCT